MSTAALESALAASGIVATVEARDRLAIIIAADDAGARSIASRRDWVVTAAAGHGFTHVALEIAAGRCGAALGRGDAPLSGD